MTASFILLPRGTRQNKARDLASWFLAVQRRYKEYLCPSVLKRLLRYMQSDRCPISSFVCNRLTPFHGGNTGSNPVGDAKKPKRLRDLFCPPGIPLIRGFRMSGSVTRNGVPCSVASALRTGSGMTICPRKEMRVVRGCHGNLGVIFLLCKK